MSVAGMIFFPDNERCEFTVSVPRGLACVTMLDIPTPSFLEGNPYFSAGFGLGILGTGLAALRGGGKAAVSLAKRHMLVTLEVTSKDKAYPWVLQWLSAQASRGRSVVGQHISVDTVTQRLANGSTTTRFEFTPCPGTHVMTYNG